MLITNKVPWAVFLRHRTKVKLFLYMPWRCKSGVEIQLHSFQTSCLKHSIPRGRTPWYQLNRRVGWRQSWSVHFGERISCPCWDSYTTSASLYCSLCIEMLSELLKGQETVVRRAVCEQCFIMKLMVLAEYWGPYISCIRMWYLLKSNNLRETLECHVCLINCIR